MLGEGNTVSKRLEIYVDGWNDLRPLLDIG